MFRGGGGEVGAAHEVEVEFKRYEIATLPSSGLRAGLSVARNDNLAAGGAYQDFFRAKRIRLALRDGAKEPRLLSANGNWRCGPRRWPIDSFSAPSGCIMRSFWTMLSANAEISKIMKGLDETMISL